ncbi:CASP-like protein [Melia azedarach]|uniref:CASP-like protein n=1 Tax=Melia azedarach TaxID=155640 RepID=A0ACC1YZK1_MELAZ|nr:CASP-like protein [Melia azedarach]
MEKRQQEPEDKIPIPPSNMRSPPRKAQLESTTVSPNPPNPPPNMHSPPREPDIEPTRRNPPTKIFSQPREPELEHTSRNQTPKVLSPPRKPGLESTSPNQPPKVHSPPREQKLEPKNRNPPTQIFSQPREPEFEPKSRIPPPKILSPPLEPEVESINSNPSPKMVSPPLGPYHNSESHSPPSDLSPEEKEDHKKPPFKSQTTPDADTVAPVFTKGGSTSQEVDAEGGHSNSNIRSGRRFSRPNLTILKRAKRENTVKRALLGFRVCGFVFSLVSFSVLAADRDRGWALDSFYRYKEFRYCMAVNVIAFAYSGFQAYDLVYQLTSGKCKGKQHLRYYFDFSMDQISNIVTIRGTTIFKGGA